MPPKHYVTFVYKNIEIKIGVYCEEVNAEIAALELLLDTVSNPLDYKIKKN